MPPFKERERILAALILAVFLLALALMFFRPALREALLVFIELSVVPIPALEALRRLSLTTLLVAYLWALGPAFLVDKGYADAKSVLLVAAFFVVWVAALRPWLSRCRG
jgi:uncharacterized protein YqhQ